MKDKRQATDLKVSTSHTLTHGEDVGTKARAAQKASAAVVVEATKDAPAGGRAQCKNAATPKAKIVGKATVIMAIESMDSELTRKLLMNDLASDACAAESETLLCEYRLCGVLREFQVEASFAMVKARETTADSKDKGVIKI